MKYKGQVPRNEPGASRGVFTARLLKLKGPRAPNQRQPAGLGRPGAADTLAVACAYGSVRIVDPKAISVDSLHAKSQKH